MSSSALIRMRVILFLLASALLYGQRLIANWAAMANVGPKHEDMRVFFYAADGILLLAAVVVLVFSFVRIARSEAGELCYDPTNPYWRLMKYVWEDKWTEQISLCKSYWLTVSLILFPTIVITMFTLILVVLVPAFVRALFNDPWHIMLMSLGVVGLSTGVVGLIFLCVWLTTKKPWLAYVWYVLGSFGVLWGFVWFPIMSIARDRQITLGAAGVVYGIKGAIFLGGMLLIVALVYAAFKFIPWLRHTWFGQLLALLKDKICPTLVACPCGPNEVQKEES